MFNKNDTIQICDNIVHPGEVSNMALPLPEQYSCAPLYMPIKVIHGKKKGPCLLIFSILKGNELNGLDIAHRVVQSVSDSDIAGTLISVPVLNVYGLTHYPSILPTGHDLASCFPGRENGSYGERLAYLFTNEILKKADYCIELQTGGLNHNILPQIYCNYQDQRAKNLAKLFQTPVITHVSLDSNCLRQTTEDLQIPLLVYQAGEAMRFDANAINLGVEGIKNIMHSLDILPGEPNKDVQPIVSRDEAWIISHSSGILHPTISLGESIEKGQLIGNIVDPFGNNIVEPVHAKAKGIVVGINTSPFIYEGLKIFKIASFLDYEKAEIVIEEWDKHTQNI